MTDTAMFAEILNRCGTVYEDWGTRAIAKFKSAVLDLIKSGSFNSSDYMGLVFKHTYTFGGAGDIALSTIFGTGYELIRFLSCVYRDVSTSTNYTVSILSYQEYIATTMNTNYAPSTDKVWYVYHNETNPILSVGTVEASDTLIYHAIMWKDWFSTSGSIEMSTYFSDTFLNTAMDLTVSKLKAEIAS